MRDANYEPAWRRHAIEKGLSGREAWEIDKYWLPAWEMRATRAALRVQRSYRYSEDFSAARAVS